MTASLLRSPPIVLAFTPDARLEATGRAGFLVTTYVGDAASQPELAFPSKRLSPETARVHYP